MVLDGYTAILIQQCQPSVTYAVAGPSHLIPEICRLSHVAEQSYLNHTGKHLNPCHNLSRVRVMQCTSRTQTSDDSHRMAFPYAPAQTARL